MLLPKAISYVLRVWLNTEEIPENAIFEAVITYFYPDNQAKAYL